MAALTVGTGVLHFHSPQSASAQDAGEAQTVAAVQPHAGATHSDSDQAAEETKDITSIPLKTPDGGTMKFVELPPDQTGIKFENPLDFNHPFAQVYVHGFAGGGVAAGDYDGDGCCDLYMTSHTLGHKLYRQVGDFKFEDVTAKAGVDGHKAWGAGAAFVDTDNDGDLDLLVCNYKSPNLLYVNNSDGTFTESGKRAGLDFAGASIMASFADYDLDGDADFYLLTNREYAALGEATLEEVYRSVHRVDGVPTVGEEFAESHQVQERVVNGQAKHFIVQAGQRDRLYRNNGDGTFTDVSQAAGIAGNHPGLSATWWDYNDDGRPDLYVANDYWDSDILYRNNGDGTFTDVVRNVVPHTTWFSMGADIGDLNNDGWMDLLVGDMSSTTHYMAKITMGDMADSAWFLVSATPRQYMRNALFLNTGAGRMWEAAFLTGLASTDWTWSVKFADLDNDGWQDAFFTNGTVNQLFDADFAIELKKLTQRLTEEGVRDAAARDKAQWELFLKQPPRREANLAFKNDGKLHFDSVGKAWGVDHVGLSYGAAMADLDRDGDLDLVVNNLGEPASLYRNDGSAGQRVLIRLVGRTSQRYGLGAKVTVEGASGTQTQMVTSARGYMSADEPLLHFGLGSYPVIARLTIQWPRGHRQTLTGLRPGRLYTITEPEGDPPSGRPPSPRTHFVNATEAAGLGSVRHRERPFDDFAREPLLPGKMSQLGPGLAFGDADGDGDDDLYLAGAAGQAGMLYLNHGQGRFTPGPTEPWAADAGAEDMGALWFDADGDGDEDLYVVSGGVECQPGDAILHDRLYLNDAGRFKPAGKDVLPDERDSGGVVAAADFDRDGDLDLFVGGRSVPGRYPVTPVSRLLRNERGRFTDVAAEAAPGLTAAGLVTGALWSDADNDGWVDLLLSLEWGPIKFFKNENSKLADRTEAAGLSDRPGWWNGIAGGDLDHDGDIDYVVTNAGLNTKYKASPDKPALLYYGDFEGTGKMSLVEAKTGGDHVVLPVRGRSCSSNAMPFIAEKFPTYRAFASASLKDIYTPECLGKALECKATCFESGVLINDGGGRFTFKPFPRIAQISPGFGATIADFNGDGHADVYFVQNLFSREPETGHWDGGMSQFLAGDGKGNLTPVSPRESGLIVTGDAKGLAVTDLNADGWPDVVVTQNDGPVLAFTNAGSIDRVRQPLAIRLVGDAGNRTAIGARVDISSRAGPDARSLRAYFRVASAEIYAGAGYLSQSSPDVFVGSVLFPHGIVVDVRWPDGSQSHHVIDPADGPRIVIRKPGT